MDWTPIITAAVTGGLAVLGQWIISRKKTIEDDIKNKLREQNQNERLDKIEAKLERMDERLDEQGKELESQSRQLQDQQMELVKISQRIDAQDKKLDEQSRQFNEQALKLDCLGDTSAAQHNQLASVRKQVEENSVRSMRLDLLHAIETDPSNQMVIIDMAKKYFVEMKGNCYMSKVFQEWADEYHVNITSIFNNN